MGAGAHSSWAVKPACAGSLRAEWLAPDQACPPSCVLSTADSSVATASKKSKKKKRKSEAAAPEEVQAGPSPIDDPLYVEHDWRLRLKVRSLLYCICMQMAVCSLRTCSVWLN